jgi:hypothetical protein
MTDLARLRAARSGGAVNPRSVRELVCKEPAEATTTGATTAIQKRLPVAQVVW